MVVARGLSLVSAAQSGDDAGFDALGFEGLEPGAADAGLDAADGAAEKPFDFGHDAPGRRPPPFPPARADGEQDPHDKAPEPKAEKVEKSGEAGDLSDAGHAREAEHH